MYFCTRWNMKTQISCCMTLFSYQPSLRPSAPRKKRNPLFLWPLCVCWEKYRIRHCEKRSVTFRRCLEFEMVWTIVARPFMGHQNHSCRTVTAKVTVFDAGISQWRSYGWNLQIFYHKKSYKVKEMFENMWNYERNVNLTLYTAKMSVRHLRTFLRACINYIILAKVIILTQNLCRKLLIR